MARLRTRGGKAFALRLSSSGGTTYDRVRTVGLRILPYVDDFLAISRTREYGADKAGAEISGDPNALASALEKISRGAQAIPNHAAERNPAAAQLYIVPVGIKQMFSTHPATEDRIAKLRAMAGSPRTPAVDRLRSNMYGKRVPEPTVPSSGARKPARSALDPLDRGR